MRAQAGEAIGIEPLVLPRLAVSLFALALVFWLSVAEFFASESMATVIDVAIKVLGIAILGLMALLYFWKFRPMTSGQRRRHLAEDGFLQIGFRKAMAGSWILSFLALVILQSLDNLLLRHVNYTCRSATNILAAPINRRIRHRRSS